MGTQSGTGNLGPPLRIGATCALAKVGHTDLRLENMLANPLAGRVDAKITSTLPEVPFLCSSPSCRRKPMFKYLSPNVREDSASRHLVIRNWRHRRAPSVDVSEAAWRSRRVRGLMLAETSSRIGRERRGFPATWPIATTSSRHSVRQIEYSDVSTRATSLAVASATSRSLTATVTTASASRRSPSVGFAPSRAATASAASKRKLPARISTSASRASCRSRCRPRILALKLSRLISGRSGYCVANTSGSNSFTSPTTLPVIVAKISSPERMRPIWPSGQK
jgi:hypothetical protein